MLLPGCSCFPGSGSHSFPITQQQPQASKSTGFSFPGKTGLHKYGEKSRPLPGLPGGLWPCKVQSLGAAETLARLAKQSSFRL